MVLDVIHAHEGHDELVDMITQIDCTCWLTKRDKNIEQEILSDDIAFGLKWLCEAE